MAQKVVGWPSHRWSAGYLRGMKAVRDGFLDAIGLELTALLEAVRAQEAPDG